MSFNKQLAAWTLLFIIIALAFTFSDNLVIASDNATNTTTNTTQNQTIIESLLDVWDTNYVYVGEPVIIYANYSYESDPIIGIEVCQFNEAYMNFNMTSGLYYYLESYNDAGNFSYEIFCSKTGYENKSEFGEVEVFQLNITQNNTNTSQPANFTNTTFIDLDGDSYSNQTDCDDNNPNINPGTDEILYNNIDDDCNPETLDYVLFNVSTNKEIYSYQETVNINIDATNSSDTYITVNTPTNISYVYIFENGTYPVMQQFSLTGKIGDYSIDAVNYYGNYTTTRAIEFEVSNTLEINIVTDKNEANVDENIHFRADISGNIGDVDLIWNMDDGTEKYDQEFDYIYDDGKSYNIVLIAVDQGGNQVIVSKNILVHDLYKLKVKVLANETGNIIENATVELDNEDKEVNSSGEVEYIVTNRTYNLEVFADGYENYDENILINDSRKIEIRLVKETDQIIPNITIVSPNNNSDIILAEFKFRFKDDTNADCSLYVSEGDGWWLDVSSSQDLEPNKEYTFKPQIDYGEYLWKIQCKDEDNNIAVTKDHLVDYMAEAEASATTLSDSGPESTYNVVQDVYDIIPDIDTFTPDEKEIASYLSMDVMIKDARRKLDMANIDLYNLKNEKDSQALIEKRDEIYGKIDTIKDQTALSVNIIDKAEFVKYAKDDELEILLKEYLRIKNLDLSKSQISNLLRQNTEAQKKISIKTTAYKVEIEYISGRYEQMTFVKRTVDTTLEDEAYRYVEFIPKELIDSTDDIIFVTQPDKILQQDPVFEISLDKAQNIVYYVKKNIALGEIPKSKAVVLTTAVEETNMLTGLAVFDNLGFSNDNKKLFIIQLVVVFILLGIYLFFTFKSELVLALPRINLGRLKPPKKQKMIKQPEIEKIETRILTRPNDSKVASRSHKVNYITEVIRRAGENIKSDIKSAALNYHEVKFIYSLLPESEKQEVYSNILDLGEKIIFENVSNLIDEAIIELAHNNKDRAAELYGEIEQEYNKLSDKNKEKLYKRCCEVALNLK